MSNLKNLQINLSTEAEDYLPRLQDWQKHVTQIEIRDYATGDHIRVGPDGARALVKGLRQALKAAAVMNP